MDINKILSNAADRDMRMARQEGAILITGTKSGLLELSYAGGNYHIAVNGERPYTLASGLAKVVKPVLMAQYEVEYA